MGNGVSEFLPFYRKFSKTIRQQSGSDKSIISFIEFSNHLDVLFLRKLTQYFNRFNKKVIKIAYGKRDIRGIFSNFYKQEGPFSSVGQDQEPLFSSSRGVIVYTKNYIVFSLLVDAMARSNLNYLVKNVTYNSQKSSNFAELVVLSDPERLFTECSFKKYKLMSISKFFIGGFLVSVMLQFIFNK
jgi:hypothetical protein